MTYEDFAEILYPKLEALRGEYKATMIAASDIAQQAAQEENLIMLSMYSTESARMQEAFCALNRAIKIIENGDPDRRASSQRKTP